MTGKLNTEEHNNDIARVIHHEQHTQSYSSSDKVPLSSTVIVDCGSGYSRASNFYRSSETNLIHATAAVSGIDALHTVMRCPQKLPEWLKRLVKMVKEIDAEATRVLLGATAGVRDLVSSGEIKAEEVERFRDLLATTMELPLEIRLNILSGEDEARYEFMAAKYCVNQCDLIPDVCDLGLLSAGGMSSQIFVNGVPYSLQTEIKKGNEMCVEHGMEKGKAEFQEHVKKVIDQNLPENVGSEKVVYVAIEMLAGAGEKAGMGGGAAESVSNAIEILTSFIEKKTKEDRMLGVEGERTWRTYGFVMSAIVGRLILERLHPESKVLFARNFELGKDHILKPSWPLGHAIEQLIWEE